ncbi:MAG TPA: GNAT family N-acetyltransferase [Pirellulales bacterium]
MPATPLSIRWATSDDLRTIVEFNRLLAVESEHKQLDVEILRRGVAELLARPELGRYFVAETAGSLVGQAMITYEWSDWRSGMFWWLQSVYVDAGFRRRGIFRALYEHVAAQARADAGVCGLRLYVENANRAALETYRQLGMQPSGHLVYELDWSSATGPTSE